MTAFEITSPVPAATTWPETAPCANAETAEPTVAIAAIAREMRLRLRRDLPARGLSTRRAWGWGWSIAMTALPSGDGEAEQGEYVQRAYLTRARNVKQDRVHHHKCITCDG